LPEVAREGGGARRRYVIREGGQEAELALSVLSPGRVIAEHTYVPDALRGRGLANRLLDALLQDAREQGFTIVPLCPFVAAQARRHPEWNELFER
jgi:predicted GNAT family acetyltransferase